jgi:predicted ferric reductase
MDPIDLSGVVGLTALGLLTANICLGLLMGVRYNPWVRWPHRRINYFRLHNWTGYAALAVVLVHPLLILLAPKEDFHLPDLLYPQNGPKQPVVNSLGALALYLLIVVVVTSYFRTSLPRRAWRLLHYLTYPAAALFFVHGLLTDPLLKDRPVDWLDAEKVFVELCFLLIVGATVYRVRWGMAHPRGRRAGVRG